MLKENPFLILDGLNKNDYETIWFDSEKDFSIIKLFNKENYISIGNIALTKNVDFNKTKSIFIKNDEKFIHKPLDYYKIYENDTMTIWRVIPPTHHIAFSDVVKLGKEKPTDEDNIYCINEDYVLEYEYYNVKLYETKEYSIWRMNLYNTFIVNLSRTPSKVIKYEPNINLKIF